MAESGNRVFLVDGTAQLYRAYFAIRGLTAPDGTPTNAVYGFTTMLRKLLKEETPSHIAVAWDPKGRTFRHERFPDYKANRPETPEDLKAQAGSARAVCRALGIPALEVTGYEADDVIASLARQANERGHEVVVVASDKDLLQLVGERVTNFNPVRNEWLDPAGVTASFGVDPERVVDAQGLMGDSVDNIPGVPGVGEKTAKAIVGTYGDLERILERADRFVAAYDARDAWVERAGSVGSGGNEEPEARARVAETLAALVEVERDDALAARYRGALESVAALDARVEPGGSAADPKAAARAAREAKKALKELDKKSAKKTWYAIAEHREKALLSRELARLDVEAPVAFDLDALRLETSDTGRVRELFASLGFRTLLRDLGEDPAGNGDVSESPAVDADVSIALDRDALDELVASCREAGRCAVRVWAEGAADLSAELVGISVAHEEDAATYVPIRHDHVTAPDPPGLDVVRAALGPLLTDDAIERVGHDVKRSSHVLREHGFPATDWALDTSVAAFVLRSDGGAFRTADLAERYLGKRADTYEDIAGSGAKRVPPFEVELERMAGFAGRSAASTLALAPVLESHMEEIGVADVYRTLDAPILPILERMETAGIAVDRDLLLRMSAEMAGAVARLTEEIHGLAGEPFNVDSPKQLREILFDRLGLKPKRKTAKGKVFSTDARTLEDLEGEHPIAAKILEYRELAKLKSTYVDALPQLVHPRTGRIHTNYHPTGAATGRLSSSDPNLQNIPARKEEGLKIREAFVPPPGAVFLAADYSQVELRVLAHLCRDPGLIEAFRAGEDIHRITAARVAGVDPAFVTPEMRGRAKAVNFGILYGLGETRLAREQGMTRKDARAFIAAYFERFAAVRDYIDRVKEDARRDGAVRTMFGRVRYFPQLQRKSSRVEQEQALRAAVNTTIQGTAADLMKLAMIAVEQTLDRHGRGARMLLQVHDELLLEVPEAELDAVGSDVRDAMEGVHPMDVPLTVDVKSGADWRAVT